MCFNPRTHEGCDYGIKVRFFAIGVSIHAPTRGATTIGMLNAIICPSFNPRTHEGCDFCN